MEVIYLIKYNPSLAEIKLALFNIRKLNQQPIIYCSKTSAKRTLPQLVGQCIDRTTIPLMAENVKSGICGIYQGAPVCITDEAEDAFIIVPQYKEDN